MKTEYSNSINLSPKNDSTILPAGDEDNSSTSSTVTIKEEKETQNMPATEESGDTEEGMDVENEENEEDSSQIIQEYFIFYCLLYFTLGCPLLRLIYMNMNFLY